VVLADTNILSTFAKISALSLLRQLFTEEGVGVVPAVYEELHNGLNTGYVALQAALELIQHRHIALVMPSAEEILGKGALPPSFDAGEGEMVAVAQARGYLLYAICGIRPFLRVYRLSESRHHGRLSLCICLVVFESR
jgi:predicted nucleic acid-binding protein